MKTTKRRFYVLACPPHSHPSREARPSHSVVSPYCIRLGLTEFTNSRFCKSIRSRSAWIAWSWL